MPHSTWSAPAIRNPTWSPTPRCSRRPSRRTYAAIPNSGCGCTAAGRRALKASPRCTEAKTPPAVLLSAFTMPPRPAHRAPHTVGTIAEALGARVIGDAGVEVRSLASIASAGPDDLTFVQSEEQLQKALQSNAGAVIAGGFAAGASSSKPLLIAQHPRLAFARAGEVLYGRERSSG